MSAVTGISGIQLSAASAAYAPTNSADVSAIASAYQVVSATATQLNAGTAYLTSVNETPISAARAGNAANASLANSAWYDGTGRMISALPDEATVSSIASSYAESAASSKLDESATADFYSTSNPSGFITGVDLSNYATTAYVDSSVSSFVDSAYVESQVSGKEDKLTFSYDDSAISAINGSALAGGGGGVVTSVEDDTVYVYGINGMLISAVEAYNADYAGSATRDNSGRFLTSLPDSAAVSAIASAYAAPKLDTSSLDRWQTGEEPAWAYSGINGIPIHPTMADYAEEAYTAESAGSATYAESADYWIDASSKLDESATADFYSTSNPSGFIDSAYVDSAVSGKADSSALSSYVPYSSLEYNTASAISGINGSALAAGSTYSAGEGIDITDDVISVEAPVDIVAGPGIVIDNPDGNTLRVSQAYPTDETVLYQAATNEGTTLQLDQYVTLSESMTHFERIRIYYAVQKAWAGKGVFESYMVDGDLKVNLHDVWYREQSGFNVWYETFTYNKYTDSDLRFTQAGGVQRAILNTAWNTTSGLTTIVYKIVGVHRLVANN